MCVTLFNQKLDCVYFGVQFNSSACSMNRLYTVNPSTLIIWTDLKIWLPEQSTTQPNLKVVKLTWRYIFGTDAPVSSVDGHQADVPLSRASLGEMYGLSTLEAVMWPSGIGVAPLTNGSSVPHDGAL